MIEYQTEPARVIDEVISQNYALYNADCVKVAQGMPDNSLHFSVSSWPFGSLYSYTDAPEDFSNVGSHAQFFEGIDFLLKELYRAMMPGRIVVTHCMELPTTIERDGVIGIYDFPGDIIRAYQKHGFVQHCPRMAIWKDPLIAAVRTHALGLAHKQIVEDSARCRWGIPDTLIVMRKPGNNPEPVSHKPSGFSRWCGAPEDEPKAEKKSDPGKNKYSHHVWQKYASPVWFDIDPSDTLQRLSAREDGDSRHICPLQLTVIRRCIELWTNPGDIVFSPFAGIGSEGYVAIGEGRKFVGAELKHSYFRQMAANMAIAADSHSQVGLFDAETV